MVNGPLKSYRDAIEADTLKPDPHQALAVEKLQSLHHALENYRPSSGHIGWKERFGLKRREKVEPPQGLYMYGDVGRGKSMLMDLFFATAPVLKKRRVHFHEFMQEVHERLNRLRQSSKQQDPIAIVAKDIAAETWLLCFDEFVVDNIADAMILGRLFEALFARDVVVITTSNRHPRDLYKNGLQRDRFLPFIDLISNKLDILELDSPTDYRFGRMETMDVYLTPHIDGKSRTELMADFEELTFGGEAGPETITVKGRVVEIGHASEGVAYVSFDELCAKALGAGDYLAIAQRFNTVIMEGIPALGPHNRDRAKRFVTLIDALYEHNVNFICSAYCKPEELYPAGDGSFEFHRTVSRLMEMQSLDYIKQPHLTERTDRP